MKEEKDILDEALERYEAKGPSAVYDLARERGITDWRTCPACEERVPVFNDLCMVCWSDLKGESK